MEKLLNKIDRRVFLFKAAYYSGLGILGAVLTWIFGDLWTAAGRFSSARWTLVAPLDRFPDNSIVPFPEHKIAILRRERRIGAISLECTHLGCTLNTTDQGFLCPCHGSDFGNLGQVYSGPAKDPLPWHDLQDREGQIWVHLGTKLESPKWLEIEFLPEI